jgi:hypothetical protein
VAGLRRGRGGGVVGLGRGRGVAKLGPPPARWGRLWETFKRAAAP